LYDSIISLRGEIGAYKTSLTLPLFIEVHVPSEESERLYIYKLILESHAMLYVFDWLTVNQITSTEAHAYLVFYLPLSVSGIVLQYIIRYL
jgi:hypothetical protein